MAIKWNEQTRRFDPNGGNSNGSFQEHDRRMREFRASHADVALVNGTRLGEAALIQTMKPLQVNYPIMMERGGSLLPDDTTDCSALVPMCKVARYKLSQN